MQDIEETFHFILALVQNDFLLYQMTPKEKAALRED